MAATLHKLVDKTGKLHVLPHTKKDIRDLARRHPPLRTDYLKELIHPAHSRTTHDHWQMLAEVRWLQHVGTGELCVIVGKQPHFLTTVAATREDMHDLTTDRLHELLSGWLWNHGRTKRSPVCGVWRLLEAAPVQVAALGDGANLRGLYAPVSVPLQEAATIVPDYRLFVPKLGTGTSAAPLGVEARAAAPPAAPRGASVQL